MYFYPPNIIHSAVLGRVFNTNWPSLGQNHPRYYRFM